MVRLTNWIKKQLYNFNEDDSSQIRLQTRDTSQHWQVMFSQLLGQV